MRRQARHRWIPPAVLVISGLAAVTALSGGAADRRRIFVQAPYLGVSCRTPNSIACDRVGLSVWLARPAKVTASIAGAPLRLDAPGWSHVAHQGSRRVYVYAGFLQPAGLVGRLHVVAAGGSRWLGADAPAPLVRFRIDYGRGEIVIRTQQVGLHAGWG